MLIISRKRGESLFIGADVQVTVVEVSGRKVRLGIEAPEDTAVWRQELGRVPSLARRQQPVGCDDDGPRAA
jgi:carbon storage regulator